MGFTRFKDVVDSQVSNGCERTYTWRKSPTQTTPTGVWFDLSMSPGNPVPKYWFDASPLTATIPALSTDGGLMHGGNVSPQQKFLRELMAFNVTATALPMPMILCDYLLYYPTIDESVAGPQNMTNNVSLTRYSNGVGVQMIAIGDATRAGGQTFQVTYTNSGGVSGQVTQLVIENGNAIVGNLVNTFPNGQAYAQGPFIPLQKGDTGVQSIQSVSMISGNDVGLFSLVLVKPLAQFSIRGIDAPVEVDYIKDFPVLPQIYDDAYLNFLCLPQGSLAASAIHGTIKTTFN